MMSHAGANPVPRDFFPVNDLPSSICTYRTTADTRAAIQWLGDFGLFSTFPIRQIPRSGWISGELSGKFFTASCKGYLYQCCVKGQKFRPTSMNQVLTIEKSFGRLGARWKASTAVALQAGKLSN